MKKGIVFALIAAISYSLSTPLGKLILNELDSTFTSGLFYLGAGVGMSLVYLLSKFFKKSPTYNSLNKNDLVYVILMVILDIIAPILLLLGLSISYSGNVSLLNNFEIVFTSLIALVFFKEKNISKSLDRDSHNFYFQHHLKHRFFRRILFFFS